MAHQVRIADTIILNKADEVSRERMAKVEERVLELNPHANLIEASELFLQRYKTTAYRIKGTVNLNDDTIVSVQSCFGQTQFQTIKKEPEPTELIALGPLIDGQEFTSVLNKMAGAS